MNIQSIKVSEIKTEKPLEALFPIGEDPLESIRIDMELNGFDEAFPIIIWEENNTIVDGHTRFKAAQKLELEEVPVLFRSFETEDDAILYAFHLQRNRRNLADDDILRCLELLDNLKPTTIKNETDTGTAQEPTKKESAELRALALGTSKTKIEKARKVLEHASDEIKEAVGSGEKTINKAFNEMQEIRRGSGELNGNVSAGLACGTRYKKALAKFMEEIRRIKEEDWAEISHEQALLDLDSIESLIG